MIRVVVYKGIHKEVQGTQHYPDDSDKEAIEWAKSQVQDKKDLVAYVWRCVDENSVPLSLMTVIMPILKSRGVL